MKNKKSHGLIRLRINILLISLVVLFTVSLMILDINRENKEMFVFTIILVILLIPIYPVLMEKIGNLEEESKQALIKEKDISLSKTSVSGIIEENQKEILDKDKDGKIAVSEFYPLTEQEVINKLISVDQNFSKENFIVWVKAVYNRIIKAFTERDALILRTFEDDNLYRIHKSEIQKSLNSNIKINIEKNYIKGVLIKDFKIEGSKEILTVALRSSIKGSMVGNEKKIKLNVFDLTEEKQVIEQSYILTFSRNKGIKTIKNKSNKSTSNCPNCGAVTNVNDKGVCDYCGTTVTSGEYDWVLIDIKTIQLIGDN